MASRWAALLAQIVAQKNADFNGLGLEFGAVAEGQGPRRGDGGADFAVRVLVEHHVEGTAGKSGAGGAGQFVRDDAKDAGAVGGIQRLEQPGIAGAEIVEAGEIGMGLEQLLRGGARS